MLLALLACVGSKQNVDDTHLVSDTGSPDSDADTDTDTDTDADTDTACTEREFYVDSDGDTFGDATSVTSACDAPTGYVSDATDCDDVSAQVYPGAPDDCADGLDADCDGEDPHCGFGGDSVLGSGDTSLTGPEANLFCGAWLDAGDLDGDGIDDLAITALWADGGVGRVFVAPGPVATSGALDTTAWRIDGSADVVGAGHALGTGDVDGDGQEDLAIGVAYDDTPGVWVVLGPITGDLTLDDTQQRYTAGATSGAGHGAELADLDGDGLAEVLIGAEDEDLSAGAVFVVGGPGADAVDLDVTFDARLVGEAPGDFVGRVVRAGPDIDGDGLGDIVTGAVFGNPAAPQGGAAYVVYGGVRGELNLADADGRYLGDRAYLTVGVSLAIADVDGDGLADAAIADGDSLVASYAGSVHICYGPAASNTTLDECPKVIYGEAENEAVGISLAAADIDEDGLADLLVGAYGESSSGTNSGAAYLFYGGFTGALGSADADAAWFGTVTAQMAGFAVAIGDFDGAGLADVAISAPGDASGGSSAGAVFVELAP